MTRRLDIIKGHMSNMRKIFYDSFIQPRSSKIDQRERHELTMDLGYIESDIKEVRNDTEVLEFERLRLRPFLLQVHHILQREHATLSKPILGWSETAIDPNAVAFCGASDKRDLLLKVCAERDLRLIDITGDQMSAHDRWDKLRSVRIVVFDLSVRKGSLRASVFHEIGLSIALGQYAVVLINEGDQVPFDVDIKPVVVGSTNSGLDNMAMAIDDALFSFPRVSGASSFDATLKHIESQIKDPTPIESVLLKQLRGVNESRIEAHSLVKQILISRKYDGNALMFPRWPGDYICDNSFRCFHITPFNEKFALARYTVEQTCSNSKIDYHKGDQGPLIDILHSIWLLTCRANGVIADLTDLNDNVCVEVGLAFALGKPILLAVQKGHSTTPNRYPDIEKMQVYEYQSMNDLSRLVSNFISRSIRRS